MPKQSEIKVPKPRRLSSGAWHIDMVIKGEHVYITEYTEALCKAKAIGIKSGLIKREDPTKKAAQLGQLVDDYIEDKKDILSPSTLRGYYAIRKGRFKTYMARTTDNINYQRMINDECRAVSAKTVKNAWGLVSAALAHFNLDVPKVSFPQQVKPEKKFLSAEQIKIFLDAIEGHPCELCALLCLHGLRLSEVKDLKLSDITDNIIHVRGSAVYDWTHTLVHKTTNKNSTSRRDVPIFIPRVLDLAAKAKGEYLVTQNESNLREGINLVCRKANLPEVGLHGLRHSFASLALITLKLPAKSVMQLGGWSTENTMRDIYTHYAAEEKLKDAIALESFFKE